MREDMGQVLVDEPRHGRSTARALAGSRRQRRNRVGRDGETAPLRIGMQSDGGGHKHFGEHLGPLYRYLRRQLDRPWSKVYGELCAALDRRSVVQAHLFEHIEDVVAVKTAWRCGQVWVHGRWSPIPLHECRASLYVHPRTGMLLVNRARLHEARRKKDERAQRERAGTADCRRNLPHLGRDCQWHRVNGLWFEVTLRPLETAEPRRQVYDVLLQRLVGLQHAPLLRERYGLAHCYAAAKRQLDGRRLRDHGLCNLPDE
jgi:hypothetical protein